MSLSVSRQLPQFTVEKNVFEFLNDLKFILYLKYDNFSTTWCITRLPFYSQRQVRAWFRLVNIVINKFYCKNIKIIYVRAHYIIQLEIHKNTSYFSGYLNTLKTNVFLLVSQPFTVGFTVRMTTLLLVIQEGVPGVK